MSAADGLHRPGGATRGTPNGSDNAGAEPAGPGVQIVAGSPTAEEIAAVTAVLAAAAEVGADDDHTVADTHPRAAWDTATRSLRAPLPTDLGWARSLR